MTMIPRTGISVDVHAFASDKECAEHPDGLVPLHLAGLLWEGERGLSGHSDGDVVAHAAADALFSAAGCGDLTPTSAPTARRWPEPRACGSCRRPRRSCALPASSRATWPCS